MSSCSSCGGAGNCPSPMKRDRILLRGMLFHGYHGVFAEENKLGQKFLVDVDAWMDLRAAGGSDDIGKSVSYAELYEQIKAVVAGPPFKLVETVANRIAQAIFLAHPAITDVRVKGLPRGFLPHVGITGGDGDKPGNSTQIVPVRLDAESEKTFWAIQTSLRKSRPKREFVEGDGGRGDGGEDGEKTEVEDDCWSVDPDAPYGRFGCFRIGFDLPHCPDCNDLSSDDSDAYLSYEDEELGLDCTDATAVLMHIGIDDSF